MRGHWGAVTIMLAAPALAQPAGPPAPVAAKTSPAEQAMARYQADQTPRAAPAPCRPRGGGQDITVCGAPDGGSSYRAPFSGGMREGARTASGDMPHVGVGGGPLVRMPNTGARLSVSGDGKIKGSLLGDEAK